MPSLSGHIYLTSCIFGQGLEAYIASISFFGEHSSFSNVRRLLWDPIDSWHGPYCLYHCSSFSSSSVESLCLVHVPKRRKCSSTVHLGHLSLLLSYYSFFWWEGVFLSQSYLGFHKNQAECVNPHELALIPPFSGNLQKCPASCISAYVPWYCGSAHML